jgi:hypothetical protein
LLIFKKPRFSRAELIQVRQAAPAFANWRLATSVFRRWTTEALHPPFFILKLLYKEKYVLRKE